MIEIKSKSVHRNEICTGQLLRGVAAILVVISHYAGTFSNFSNHSVSYIYDFGIAGASGVDLFFCISGYVLLHSISATHNNSFNPLYFIWQRILRIYPLYITMTILMIFLVVTINIYRGSLEHLEKMGHLDPTFILASIALWPTQGPSDGTPFQPFLVQGWTLSYEMYFYITLAFSVFCVKNKTASVFAVSALMAGIAFISESEWLGNPIIISFVLGMLIQRLPTLNVIFSIFSIFLGVFIIICAMPYPAPDKDRIIIWGFPMAAILYGFVSLEGKIRPPSLLIMIGNISYSIYLTHDFVLYIISGVLRQKHIINVPLGVGIPAIALGVCVSITLGLFTYRFVERPMTRYVKRRGHPLVQAA